RGTPVVGEIAAGLQRAGVVRQGAVQVTLYVGEHTQVLLDPRAKPLLPSAQLQRPAIRVPSRVQRTGLQLESGQGVERLAGRLGVGERKSRLIAALAELARGVRLPLAVADEGKLSQCPSEEVAVAAGLGRGDCCQVAISRAGETTLPIVLQCLFVQRPNVCLG